jgi:penicillin-binding protein 2
MTPARLRFVVFSLFLTGLLAALVVRLTYVQVFQGTVYAAAARANQIRRIPIAAPRGLIVDRNGTVVVRSRPSFVVALIPSRTKDIDHTIRALVQILGIPAATLERRLYHHRGINYKTFDEVQLYEPYGPVILASDLTRQQMARLAESQNLLPGVDLEEQPVRDYPHGTLASHVVGYVGQITEDEYAKLKAKGYSPNDVIGEDGLENTYDQWLRGRVGGQNIEVDAQGSLVNTLDFVDPQPGNTLVLTLDWRLQEIAENALANELKALEEAQHHRFVGAVVAIDPADGGIMALVSQPNFNPNDFATGISLKRYAHYSQDPLQPLNDYAIDAATPTGSTFKMVTASAAISAGVLGLHEIVYDSGSWNCHGQMFTDVATGGAGQGSIGVEQAIAASSDGFFYQMGDRLGHERLRKYALDFGLGAREHIDLPGEFAGNWPTEQWVQRTFGKDYHLEPSDVCQLAIGQGSMQATPLQIANVAATVVNGGTLYRPHLVAAIRDPAGRTVKTFDHPTIREVPVTKAALAAVKAGMALVTGPGGTGAGLGIDGLPFGGKTGTVETGVGGKGQNTTWFVCFAPVDHPKIALAVFVEKSGGYGGGVAAPVAREILLEYFKKGKAQSPASLDTSRVRADY